MIFLIFLIFPVSAAEEGEGLPKEFYDALDQMPDSSDLELPDGLFSEDPEEVGRAVEEMAGFDYLSSVLLDVVGMELGSALRLLAVLCGLLILSAVFGAARSSLGTDGLSAVFRFCSAAAILSAILWIQLKHMESVELFFERLSGLMGAMIPALGALWAMGGNVTTASAGTGTLYVFLTVCQRICAVSVLPVCGFCTVLALCNTLAPEVGVKGLSGAVKKIYTFSLGMIMTLLLLSLSSQTTLTAAADSAAARTAKLVSSTVIPIVGGSVGETLRTLASGVQYMKGVVGIGGIVLLFLLLLPCLISLILTRFVFLLATGAADLLGCDQEGRLLGELGGIWGTMIAVVSMCSVMFMLALTLFIKTVVAVG